MSVDAATPAGSAGTIGDRYRLLECIAGEPDGPAAAWRAWDILLARPVTLTVVRPGGETAAGFLSHAHAVSTVVHPSLARVYDAVDEESRAYVVSEWVAGTPLSALLREGALDPSAAAQTVARVSEGVAAAHAAGVSFGGVHPDHVIVTPNGQVTIAQVVGDGRATPIDDVRGLGALLYAAMTGTWPLAATGGAAELRPAPTANGHLLTPRQARAGVPEDLSTLAVRALDPSNPHGVRSSAAMAAVLGERAGPPQEEFDLGYDQVQPDPRPARPRWLTLAIPITAGLVALGLLGWLVGNALGQFPGSGNDKSSPPATAGGGSSAAKPTQTQAALQQSKSAETVVYDPEGDGGEDTAKIPLTTDGDPGTSWSTVDYSGRSDGTARGTFGNLKSGVGLAYSFDQPVKLKQVKIVAQQGVTVEIRAGEGAPSSTKLSGYKKVGGVTGNGSAQTIQLQGASAAQYYVVWITRLVPNGNGKYSGSISEVTFLR